MATSTQRGGYGQVVADWWYTGVGLGIAGVLPMVLFNTAVLGKDLFPLFGLLPFAVVWGLLYVGLARTSRLEPWATDPASGVVLGIAFSFLVWWGPQVGKPTAEYVSAGGAVQLLSFGVVVGLLYAYSPRAARA